MKKTTRKKVLVAAALVFIAFMIVLFSRGYLQSIYIFNANDVSVVFTTDLSGSMDDNCGVNGTAIAGLYPCKINSVLDAEKSTSSLILTNGNVSSTVGYVGYCAYTTTSSGLWPKATLSRLLSSIDEQRIKVSNVTGCGTCLNCSCISCGLISAEQTILASANTNKAIILFADGMPNRCGTGTPCCPNVAEADAIARAGEIASRGIKLYVIGLDISDEVNDVSCTPTTITANDTNTFLQNLASAGNGTVYFSTDYEITNALSNIYVNATSATSNIPSNVPGQPVTGYGIWENIASLWNEFTNWLLGLFSP